MTTATLVIDVQQGLCEGEWCAFDAAQVIQRINHVTAASRAAGMAVVFVQHETPPGGELPHGSAAWQLADGLHAESTDLRVRKTTCDSFHRTDLQALLQARGVTELVVCGMHTEFCVDTTVRRALALGYPVRLVADAHTTQDSGGLSPAQVIEHHNRTLANIESFGPRVRLERAAELSFSDAMPRTAATAG